MGGDKSSRINLLLSVLMVFCLIRLACSSNLTDQEVRVSKTIFVAEKRDNPNSLVGDLINKLDLDRASNNQVQFDDQINTGRWPILRPQKSDQFGAPIANGTLNNNKAGFLVHNGTVYNQQQRPLETPSTDFLGLFDDLWKIKNKSASALIYLEYYDQKLNPNLTKNLQPPKRGQAVQTTSRPANENAGKNNFRRPIQQIVPKPMSNSNQQRCNVLVQIGSIIGGWFQEANRKIASLFVSLPMFARRRSTQRTEHRQTVNIDTNYNDDDNREANTRDDVYQTNSTLGDGETEKKPNHSLSEKSRTRRQSGMAEKEELDKSANVAAPLRCILLDESQANKCQSIELLVGKSLSNNFPGTLAAIESNCRHVTFLLGKCWPRELKQLSASTWNESLIAQSEFSLPTRTAPSEPRSCGLEPQLSEVVLSRATWMWQNLCVDKKFRQDYIDNRNCLSLWTREKAYQVCNNEYRRMQTNPTVDEYSKAAAPQSNKRYATPRSLADIPDAHNVSKIATMHQAALDQSQLVSVANQSEASVDNELQSKVICCGFDIFLRCVNRHAIRDCGRSGGQFLINFLSRIGTDDFKYICNGPKLVSHRGKHGPRKSGTGIVDKSPFLEFNYCTESKVAAFIYGHSSSSGMDRNRNAAGRPAIWRNNNRAPANVNYDPTFYEDDTIQPERNSAKSIHSVSICVLIPWILAFSFNAFLLCSITGFII